MAFHADDVVDDVQVATPGYVGAYSYGGGLKFSERARHDPWVWMRTDNPGAPHLTVYAKDMPNDVVTRFHLSYHYNGQAHKIVHVYFNIKNGVVKFSNIDANRCGGDADAASKAATAQKATLTQLASELVTGAFGG